MAAPKGRDAADVPLIDTGDLPVAEQKPEAPELTTIRGPGGRAVHIDECRASLGASVLTLNGVLDTGTILRTEELYLVGPVTIDAVKGVRHHSCTVLPGGVTLLEVLQPAQETFPV